MKGCCVRGCDRPHKAHGLCEKHYDQRRYHDPTRRRCSVPGCSNPHNSHGLCTTHRARLQNGRPLNAPVRPRRHILSDIDEAARTAHCAACGRVGIRRKGRGWRCVLGYPSKSRQAGRDRSYREHLADHCERCGFAPEHTCQLDIHHRDGDRTNNAPENLGTVCANCHRLVTLRKIAKGAAT